ncbi:MAG: hypothetical protein ACRDNZ_12160 [Streptosporangiaceae bacterium]
MFGCSQSHFRVHHSGATTARPDQQDVRLGEVIERAPHHDPLFLGLALVEPASSSSSVIRWLSRAASASWTRR